METGNGQAIPCPQFILRVLPCSLFVSFLRISGNFLPALEWACYSKWLGKQLIQRNFSLWFVGQPSAVKMNLITRYLEFSS